MQKPDRGYRSADRPAVYDLYGLTEDEIKIVEAVFWAVLAVMAGGRE